MYRLALFASLAIALSFAPRAAEARTWVDDYAITVTNATQVASKRAQLIDNIWGSQGFPTGASDLADANAATPLSGLTNLARVEKLQTSMPRLPGLPQQVIVRAYHFVPTLKRNRL